MNIQLSLPTLADGTPENQLRQLHHYLRRTVRQLNTALSGLEQGADTSRRGGVTPSADAAQTETDAQIFQNIKGLIIKSSDIVNAYYEKIDQLLRRSGSYVATSDFGAFTQELDQKLQADSQSLTQLLQRTEELSGSLGDWQKHQNAYIRYGAVGTTLDPLGLAADTAPGIEIGDFQQLQGGEGVTVQKRFARFTAYGLELFGASKDRPIACFSGDKLTITNAHILQQLQLGGYLLQTKNGIAFSWVGEG